MTIQGAISQLVALKENSMMPSFFKPYFEKIIETVSDYVETSAEPKWVAVTERLPEKTGSYLGYVSNRSNVSPYGYIITCDYYAMFNFWATGDEVASNNVVAWMPLPTPWKGEE